MGLKRGLKSGQELSKTEKEILAMFSEFLTIKNIARQRKTSVQAVYKIRTKLINLGFLSRLNKVENFKCSFKPHQKIRLHGQEFNIRIIFKDERYKAILKETNLLTIDGNTIKLYQDAIEVYSGQMFYADDTNKATAKSLRYFSKFFIRLENDLKVTIIKHRYHNIRQVNAHYAEINNELARECEIRGDKIRIYAKEDGKLWFVSDYSLNFDEIETLHPSTAKQDMGEVVKPFFNDLRDNRPPTLSDIMKVIKETTLTNKETSAGLNAVANILKSLYEQNGKIDNGKNKELMDYFG